MADDTPITHTAKAKAVIRISVNRLLMRFLNNSPKPPPTKMAAVLTNTPSMVHSSFKPVWRA